jgi:DNA recombination-dependent growth factor C
MPLLKGNLSFARFTVELPDKSRSAAGGANPPAAASAKDLRRSVPKGLRRKAFQPLVVDSEDDRSAGWVEVENSELIEFPPERLVFGEHFLFAYRVDRLRVPSSVVKSELAAFAAAYEEENGHPPTRSQKKAQKELIERKLKRRAFPSRKVYDVSWNTQSGVLAIWATAQNTVEEMHLFIEESLEIRLHPMTPGAIADSLDLPRGALTPTADLIGAVLAGEVGGE